MQLFSSSPKSQFSPFFTSQNPNPPKFFSKIPIKSLLSSPLFKSTPFSSKQSTPSLDEKILIAESDDEDDDDDKRNGGNVSDGMLVVRRPVMESSSDGEESENSLTESEEGGSESAVSSSSSIDQGLSEFAKKMPIFEPERVDGSSEKPLPINLELALYRAKVLARNFRYEDAEKILRQCISFWPEDGRPYVSLGKILSKQSRYGEARSVYEMGSQATQGENPYIWQCWAVLENKMGNIRRAREIFDAATVADKRHVAAWHGWAVLELKQGNIKKARNLLGKGIKYCGGNEYIYQTLALLEAKGNRIEQARYLFRQATLCNPKSCASWLAWAQLEMQQENNRAARQLFEKAVQASPKNRFAWHVWAIFEANLGDIEKGRKLLKIGHALNPRDPVLLQSLALLEYKHSSANLARVLFRRASELDPRHQPVWIAWGWVEWKEGNIATARELYQRALSINSTSESAARCLQAWGVLEQRLGNMSAARRLFRSSLNINSQSYITWQTWASLEEEQGNAIRAEEIRNLYFQQRTEVVDDASWVMGFLDIIDPALDSIKKFLNMGPNSDFKGQDSLRIMSESTRNTADEESTDSSSPINGNIKDSEEDAGAPRSNFDLDAFIKEKLSLDASKLDAQMEVFNPKKIKSTRRIWKSENRSVAASP
ncbi:protein high chlorophyll fluorescent 107 isoform X1 [Magnolia sinica]|uniref:protein high chlorophyll fluorescent 107 isoform X1 n=1 Tax=Magnolia sinica TaxID=86752 RepID=UPI00265B0C3D|nr:protein high chlorophyll fluorescent 107 isoform X1 [Magnolia sinica]XP_058076036.1 protein high chlorophyll fluorescent 107 isoform X1 [Magnolia sinica]